ncbi:MAG: NUDIX hydrolase [Oscillospiraceae bacterium]|nr:NUDIX hydrolase [Oscillospiraceae bacterium]
MAHFEKKLSEKTIYEGRVITLTTDQALLENGKTALREVVHHPGGACVAALTEDRQVYMVRQYRYAVGEELWELPAGKLEKGEDPFEAAKRELGEEVGVTADEYIDLGRFYPTVGYCNEVIYCWAAKGLHTVPLHPDEDEFLTPCKMPLDEAAQLALSGEIRDGKTVAMLLKLKLLCDTGRL